MANQTKKMANGNEAKWRNTVHINSGKVVKSGKILFFTFTDRGRYSGMVW